MPRLICLRWAHIILLVLSCRGSFNTDIMQTGCTSIKSHRKQTADSIYWLEFYRTHTETFYHRLWGVHTFGFLASLGQRKATLKLIGNKETNNENPYLLVSYILLFS